MNFGADFAMMLSVVAGEAGKPREGGMVLKDGKYDLIKECSLEQDWDENWYQTALRVSPYGFGRSCRRVVRRWQMFVCAGRSHAKVKGKSSQSSGF
jgi:hypothetical protein